MIRICGPKLANCCFLLSLWGVIMLLLLGVFFSTRSVALIDDLPGKMEEGKGYKSSARNCYIAAGIYGVTMLLALHQKWVNSRTGDTQKLTTAWGSPFKGGWQFQPGILGFKIGLALLRVLECCLIIMGALIGIGGLLIKTHLKDAYLNKTLPKLSIP